MQKCDVCGVEAERESLTARSVNDLVPMVKKGFQADKLEVASTIGDALRNKAAFEKTQQPKWNASSDDWLLCLECSMKVQDYKNMRRGGVALLILGVVVMATSFIFNWPHPNIVLLVIGSAVFLVGSGLLSKSNTQSTATKVDLESLKDIKITPEMIEWARQELRAEVPNVLIQLQDSSSEKRASAARILGEAGDASNVVISALINALDDSDFRVLVNAAVSLDKLRPEWTKSVDGGKYATKLAAAIIDNKHRLEFETRMKVIDVVEKMDPPRGEGLRMLAQFEHGIDSAVKQSAVGQSLGLDPSALNMEDKLTLLLSQMGQDSKQTVSVSNDSPFSHVTGKSLFYRCPSCNVLLRKRSVEGIADAVGTTSCSECNASFNYGDVYYKGLYDIAEVEGKCPSCNAVLRGPTDDLLGKPCPSCNAMLPSTAR